MRRIPTILAAGLLALLSTGLDAAAPRLATPVFLLPYAEDAAFIDFRPAINAAGNTIVFERQLPLPNKSGYSDVVDLYITPLANPAPKRLVPDVVLPGNKPSPTRGTTRPDWCWQSENPSVDGPIAFAAVAPLPDDDPSVFFKQKGIYTMAQPQAGAAIRHLPNTTAGMFYPTWFPDCANLAVDVSGSIRFDGQKGPETKKFDLSGNLIASLSGTKHWAGFPSVNQRNPRLLALAAQRLVASGYDENLNYVYIANTAGTPPRVTPLDPRAPENRYVARFEGRAPTWSPDGRWIAFESNRHCALPAADPYFAIFIQDAEGRLPARQVTDCGYNAQHAKWYRQPVNGRTLLITTVRMHPTYTGNKNLTLNARGIAALDVTPFARR